MLQPHCYAGAMGRYLRKQLETANLDCQKTINKKCSTNCKLFLYFCSSHVILLF